MLKVGRTEGGGAASSRGAHGVGTRKSAACRLTAAGLALAWTVGISACRPGTPTSPAVAGPPAAVPPGAGALLQLSGGPHLLVITGTALGGCSIAAGAPVVGVSVPVVVRADGEAWLAQAASQSSDLRLRLAASGVVSPTAVGVAGALSGSAVSAVFGAEAKVIVEGEAAVRGEQLKGTAPLIGEARGPVRFLDAGGPLATCDRIIWSLGPSSTVGG